MRNLILPTLAALLLVSGCSDYAAKDAVKRLLNDPDSAKFSRLSPGKEKGDVCGFVNAKNRMGGYVGDAPFFYQKHADTVAIVKAPEDSDFRMLWLDIRSGSLSNTESFEKVAMKCDLVQQWPSVCTISLPEKQHVLCGVLRQPKELLQTLKDKYG